MKKQYVKNPIPPEISEDGGASILFVNKQTVPLDGAIREALDGNYCAGQATLIRNFFFGLMRSMADGVRRDGHARQIANFLTVYPVFKGEVDLDRGYDPAKNKVMIRARLLDEMDLDITDWSFEDVTPGKRSFRLTSCTTGELDGEYRLGGLGHLNGKDLPSTAAGEELRVHWEVEGTDKSGDIPAAKLFSEIDRADIAADALAELASPAYDGKRIVFTARGNFSTAKVAATLRYATPPGPKRRVEVSGYSASSDNGHTTVQFHLENAADLAGYSYDAEMSSASASFKADGEPVACNAISGKNGEWRHERRQSGEPRRRHGTGLHRQIKDGFCLPTIVPGRAARGCCRLLHGFAPSPTRGQAPAGPN